MIKSELVTFSSHSRTHPYLNMAEQEEAEEEIIGSKGDLESKLKVDVAHFSYPHGSYNESDIEMLKGGGYVSAVTIAPGVNSIQADPYQLKRVFVDPRASEYTLAMMITGLWHLMGLNAH